MRGDQALRLVRVRSCDKRRPLRNPSIRSYQHEGDEVVVNEMCPLPGSTSRRYWARQAPDLRRTMFREFAQRMMDAEVEGGIREEPGRVPSRGGRLLVISGTKRLARQYLWLAAPIR